MHDAPLLNILTTRTRNLAALASRRSALIALLLLSVAAVPIVWATSVFLHAPAVGVFHDDGIYLVTAKALASGDGYRIASLPGSPHQTKYPILFPFVLSLVWRVAPRFPDNLIWLRLVPLAAGVGWLVASWRVLRRMGTSPELAILALALTAASPWTIFLSTTTLSETLFALLIASGLLLLLRPETGRDRSALAAGLLFGAATLTRTAGIGTAAGGLLFLATHRRWRSCVQFVAAVALVAAPWFVWSLAHAAEPIVDQFYSAANYASWNVVFNYSWTDKLAIVGVNSFWATQVGQFWGLPFRSWPAFGAAAACTFWAVRGLWMERDSAVTLVCLTYLALLLAWAFPPLRFMVPILPFLVRAVFTGAGRLRPVAFGVLSVLALTSAAATWRVAQTSAARGGTWFNASQVDDWDGMRDLLQWVDIHTPKDAVAIATHDPTVYLFTGRRAVRPDSMDPVMLYYNVRGRRVDPEQDAEQFRQRILMVGADYVVITPRDAPARIDLLSSRFPGSFTIVHGSRESGHAVYRVDRGRLAGG